MDKNSGTPISKSSVEGVLGVVPLDENRWMLVGDLALRIPELWKVNQALDFRFTRTDIDYTSTSLSIQQPIREQFLIDAFVELEQRDSVYQQSIVGLGGRWIVDADQTYTLNLTWENSSSTRQLQTNLHAYQGIALELGTYQRRNYRFKTSYVIRMNDSDYWEFFTAGAYFQFFEPNMDIPNTNETVWSAGFSYSFRTDFGRVQLALATPLWSLYKGSKLHLNVAR